MSQRGQKILAPVFNPKSQPGYVSRFRNAPFENFFGDWKVSPIAPEKRGPDLQIRQEDPVQKYGSKQSPNVAPSRRK